MGIEKANAVNTHLSGIWCCRLPSESVPGFVPMLCPFTLQRTNFLRIRGCSFKKSFLSTFQRTEICRLLSMPVRKTFLCWLRELVSAQAIFKTLRGDRACKALSLGEVAAAVRLRIAGFGEGTPQQDSDGTERAKCEIWHHGRILLSAAPNLPSLYNGHFFGKKQGMYL